MISSQIVLFDLFEGDVRGGETKKGEEKEKEREGAPHSFSLTLTPILIQNLILNSLTSREP